MVYINLILFILGVILTGFVVSTTWGWFIVPLFHLPVLNIPYAIGIMVFVSCFSSASTRNSRGLDYELQIEAIVVPLTILGMGWFVHYFFILP